MIRLFCKQPCHFHPALSSSLSSRNDAFQKMFRGSGCQKDTLGSERNIFCHLISWHGQLRWVTSLCQEPRKNCSSHALIPAELETNALALLSGLWKQIISSSSQGLSGETELLSCVCHFSLSGGKASAQVPWRLQALIPQSHITNSVPCVNYLMFTAIGPTVASTNAVILTRP